MNDRLGISATEEAARVLELIDPLRCIETCAEEAKAQFRVLLFLLALEGYGRVRVVKGRRSLEEQRRLYGMGRTARECRRAGVPERYARPRDIKVTWTTPFGSRHVSGHAIDLAWSMYTNVAWGRVSEIAGMCGLKWGGNWEVRDYGHFEIG